MPFLALVHLRELRCAQCGELLAAAGARSFIVDEQGEALPFAPDEAPAEMATAITCSAGHESILYVPNEIAAEEVLNTPEDAPIGSDAVVRADVP
jgi:hypothetical protein